MLDTLEINLFCLKILARLLEKRLDSGNYSLLLFSIEPDILLILKSVTPHVYTSRGHGCGIYKLLILSKWRARDDSNIRHSPSEGDTLSS